MDKQHYTFRFAIAVLLGLIFVVPISAQGKSVVADRRDGQITIAPDGTVHVRETWQIHFIGGPFTNAYREIPLVGVSRITNWSVSEQGRAYTRSGDSTPYTFQIMDTASASKITWYYPATTDQVRTFELSYILNDALRRTANGQEFYWKFIETDRQYSVTTSAVVLTLPEPVSTNQIVATAYLNGNPTNGAKVINSDTVEYQGGPFAPDSEWEIRVQYPHVQNDALCFDVPHITNCIAGRFRQYWEGNGGLPVFGYPISPSQQQSSAEGTFLTQFFERNRFELHPENTPPYDVLLGRLGDDELKQQGRDWTTFPKATPGTPHYFAQTGHAIAPVFWTYWSSHGLEFDGQAGTSSAESLALFGLPLSEPQMETNTSGDRVLTQWFERARFEDHGAKGVLLGLLGNEVSTAH